MTRANDDTFYHPREVERIAQNYLHIRSTLLGSPRVAPNRQYITDRPADEQPRERPLGYSEGQSWPFHETPHARSVIDGKAKANAALELHVALMDFEQATHRMADRDLDLLYKYFVFGTHTLDELCLERGVTSRSSMQNLLMRIIRRMTRLMNNEQD